MEFVSYDIAGNDFHRAGAASRSIKEHLKRIGAGADAIRRAMIAAYEAEMNVVIHSVGGRLEASLSDSQIDVSVIDDGPGIPDVEQAMVEGYSTASAEARALGFGAGMGLPNIRRNSDRFRIASTMGEGTRVSFTIMLSPENAPATRPISIYASADKCRDCRACLSACPTQAMRVRSGRPSILEHLCIDCTACIAACSSQALVMRDEVASLDAIQGKADMLLVIPPALLAGCGPDYPPVQVLAALQGLGFAGVITSEPYEQALRTAAAAGAGGADAGRASAGSSGAGRASAGGAPVSHTPVIVPSCPAIVNLIELRFPSLVPHLAPFDSPWEAIQASHGERPVAYVVSCPSQRSALLTHAPAASGPGGGGRESRRPAAGEAAASIEFVTPEVIRQAVMIRLTGSGTAAAPGEGPNAGVAPRTAAAPASAASATPATPVPTGEPRADAPATSSAPTDGLLTVTGLSHVIAVLEELEDGLLEDVQVVDPYACDGGCFGSPLLAEDHHVATRRWERGRAAIKIPGPEQGVAVPRRRPFAARPGIRLDADMAKAIEKLGQMQAVIHSLPGRDCGACGAPTCAALAEDIVMGRAGIELCPYVSSASSEKEAGKP